MHDNGAPKHALRSYQLDKLVGRGTLAIALAICLEVAQIADVAVAVLWCTVLLVVWVDWGLEESARNLITGVG